MMADRTITQLTATTSVVGADEIPMWVAGSGVTRKITRANFLSGYGALATAGTWTAIQMMQAGVAIGVAEALLSRSADGILRQRAGYGTIANNGLIELSAIDYGMVLIFNATDAGLGLFLANGASTTALLASSAIFSNTPNTASRLNIYTYLGRTYMQNLRGATVTFQALVLL